MKVKENRIVTVTYCDYCKQEIKGPYRTLVNGCGKNNYHYCNQKNKGFNGSCLIKSRIDKTYQQSINTNPLN